jgi:hypothetical protein
MKCFISTVTLKIVYHCVVIQETTNIAGVQALLYSILQPYNVRQEMWHTQISTLLTMAKMAVQQYAINCKCKMHYICTSTRKCSQ